MYDQGPEVLQNSQSLTSGLFDALNFNTALGLFKGH